MSTPRRSERKRERGKEEWNRPIDPHSADAHYYTHVSLRLAQSKTIKAVFHDFLDITE
jgi:hypothetical protein